MHLDYKSCRTRLAATLGAAVSVVLFVPSGFPATHKEDAAGAEKVRVAAEYGKLPLSFEANRGQVDASVRFLSMGNGYSILLTDSGAVMALDAASPAGQPGQKNPEPGNRSRTEAARARDLIHIDLAGAVQGAAGDARVEGLDQLPGVVNYFVGNDPAGWRRDIPTYARVRYAQVYPGVDLVFYGNQRQLEYDFVAAPGADVRKIQMQFSGARRLELRSGGDLAIVGQHGEVSFHKPVVYQQGNGERKEVPGRFTLLAGNKVGFAVGAYDRTQPLIIDPVLAYSTYLGGSNGDAASAIAVDSEGNAYVTGYTGSTNFPVTRGAFQTSNKLLQIDGGLPFVSKLNASGTKLIYSTFLGGTGITVPGTIYGDVTHGIAVDKEGNAYIAGGTYSLDFPVTAHAFQKKQRALGTGLNGFLTKLNPQGDDLVYSTYLGGTYFDQAQSVALDAAGNAYVAGTAGSADFPVTSGAFQTKNLAAKKYGVAGFITKFNATGNALIYSTFLGGALSGNQYGPADGVKAIAVDNSGSAYVTGSATSIDFPVTGGAFQTKNASAATNGGNAFVTKLNPEGTAIDYSTYLGGRGFTKFDEYGDLGMAIAVDRSGYAYVAGQSYSPDFPVTGEALQRKNLGSSHSATNAFVTKLNQTGSDLVYSTFLGGTGYFSEYYQCYWGDTAYGIAVDEEGNAYVAGTALSPNFPVSKGAFQTVNQAAHGGGANGFVTMLNPEGSKLLYSTYLGGNLYDTLAGLAIDEAGGIYVAGFAASSDFPVTQHAFQTVNKNQAINGSNAFITKLSMGKLAPTGRLPERPVRF